MSVTIYHNPRCSKSRKTLEIISESGVSHDIVLYLENTPSAERILAIAAQLEQPVSDLLRRGESVVKEANDLPNLADDEALAAWIADHPIALQRPLVVHHETGRAVIGRPPENVEALLTT